MPINIVYSHRSIPKLWLKCASCYSSWTSGVIPIPLTIGCESWISKISPSNVWIWIIWIKLDEGDIYIYICIYHFSLLTTFFGWINIHQKGCVAQPSKISKHTGLPHGKSRGILGPILRDGWNDPKLTFLRSKCGFSHTNFEWKSDQIEWKFRLQIYL